MGVFNVFKIANGTKSRNASQMLLNFAIKTKEFLLENQYYKTNAKPNLFFRRAFRYDPQVCKKWNICFEI